MILGSHCYEPVREKFNWEVKLKSASLTMLISDMVSMLAMSKLIPTVTGPSTKQRKYS